MLLNWLKKDLAKDVALITGIGAGLQSEGRTQARDRGCGLLTSTALGIVALAAEVLCASGREEDIHRPVEVLDTRNPVTRDWVASDRCGIRDF